MAKKMSKPPSRLRKILKRSLIGVLVFLGIIVVFVLGLFIYIDNFCLAQPPKIDESHRVFSASLKESKGIKTIEGCWIKKRQGLYRMVLKGDPLTLGYCHARLTEELIRAQEAFFIKKIREFVPSTIKLFLLKKYLTWRNRNISSFIDLEYRVEILGIARGQKDMFSQYGPIYHRTINYHAAHDISHVVMDNPLFGCTSFAAWGNQTKNKHLLLGRNFDFNAGKCFDVNKIVMKFEPSKGLKFISVSWPGMIGVVSGINEKRIAVTINAASSSDKRQIGTPVSLVIRKVLQYASTLEEAIQIIKESKVFVSDCYLIADGKTSTAVVVEKTPLRSGVRRTKGDLIICSNHLQTENLKDDPENLKHIRESTTVVRYNRMAALLKKYSGSLTPLISAKILRDYQVPGNKLAYQNPAAINGLIATHSVIIDVTRGIIWVSQSPHQLGIYVPFGIDKFEDPPNAEIIPADPILKSGVYKKITQSNSLLKSARKYFVDGNFDGAQELFKKAWALNPAYYRPPFFLGKIALKKGETSQAVKYLKKAQSLYPAYRVEREAIATILKGIQDGK